MLVELISKYCLIFILIKKINILFLSFGNYLPEVNLKFQNITAMHIIDVKWSKVMHHSLSYHLRKQLRSCKNQ